MLWANGEERKSILVEGVKNSCAEHVKPQWVSLASAGEGYWQKEEVHRAICLEWQ